LFNLNTSNLNTQITFFGKITAGILLIFFTAGSGTLIIAYWPDRLPGPKENIAPLYKNEPFHVRLACVPDSPCCAVCMYDIPCDSARLQKNDTTTKAATGTRPGSDSLSNNSPAVPPETHRPKVLPRLIHLNTLLLILVALGGFAGNMIHIATSFTTFVGVGKFEKSWLLWYFVKPFTASALALGFYFVFRGGFLTMSADASNINLYGIMTLSILTGLFTDTATLKLKEVFEVLFKPKDDRQGKLDSDIAKINGVKPTSVKKGSLNTLVLSGVNLDKTKFVVTIEKEAIKDTAVTATSITFGYTIPHEQEDATELTLRVTDEKGKEHFTTKLTVN
jgi:hypothetical protein